MISALKKLQAISGQTEYKTDEFATMKIAGTTSSFVSLFSSHPPLEQRIQALQNL